MGSKYGRLGKGSNSCTCVVPITPNFNCKRNTLYVSIWNRDENITLIIQYTNPTPKHMGALKL
jgi:hypothetical protein